MGKHTIDVWCFYKKENCIWDDSAFDEHIAHDFWLKLYTSREHMIVMFPLVCLWCSILIIVRLYARIGPAGFVSSLF